MKGRALHGYHYPDDWAGRFVRRQLTQRLTQQDDQTRSHPQRQKQVEERVRHWIAHHPTDFERERSAVSERLKTQYRFTGADGWAYVYLGDLDSYLWLRHARNYLRTGTTCDVVVDGACLDTYANAPVGTRMIYRHSAHIAAIVVVHTLLTWVNPHYPLSASAFWVPVIVGGLAVVPAFGIGRRLTGNVGGLCAAVLIALHPVFLQRSIGSDNDVWNVALPLFMVWTAMAALDAKGPLRPILLSVLAGSWAGIHAWTWRGWLFTAVVLVAGLLGHLLLLGGRCAVWQRTVRVGQAPGVRRVALVLLVFVSTAGVWMTLIGTEASSLRLPLNILASVVGWRSPGAGGVGDDWPNVLHTVAELRQPGFGAITQAVGGRLFFWGGLLGLLGLCLPRERWRWPQYAVFVCGATVFGVLSTASGLSRHAIIGLLALPLGGALLLPRRDTHVAYGAAAGVVVVWFLMALHMAYDGIRWLLLFDAPFGLACGVAMGSLYAGVSSLTAGRSIWYRVLIRGLLSAVLGLLLLQAGQRGYAAARGYVPEMHDAWWDTLTYLREAAAPDAIVNTWWDYGHWVKYVAERRVSHDGSTLLTHVPHWVAKALVTSDSRENLGILRMLNCGSDATPLSAGQLGAYGQLRARGDDPHTAYARVEALVTRHRSDAMTYLAHQGFTTPESAHLLQATHCLPPESYLLLSTEFLHKSMALLHLGHWNPHRTDLPPPAQVLPPTGDGTELATRDDTTEPGAPRFDVPGTEEPSSGQLTPPAVPSQAFLAPQWFPCRGAPEQGEMVCDILAQVHPARLLLERFVYRPAAPGEAQLSVRRLGAEDTSGTTAAGAPALIILAGDHRQEEITPAAPAHVDLGVLVDLPRQRILIGAPLLLRSTLVHLLFLDGRYIPWLTKFDERTLDIGDMRERVVTWKINWEGL